MRTGVPAHSGRTVSLTCVRMRACARADNYKFFLLSLFYGALCSAWVIASTLPEVIAAWPPFSSVAASSDAPALQHAAAVLDAVSAGVHSQAAVDAAVLVTLVCAVLALVPCALALGVHLWLVAQGRTFYEWRLARSGRRAGKSLFDYGALNNFSLTLGIYPLLWLLPTRSGIEGNGIFWPEQERIH